METSGNEERIHQMECIFAFEAEAATMHDHLHSRYAFFYGTRSPCGVCVCRIMPEIRDK